MTSSQLDHCSPNIYYLCPNCIKILWLVSEGQYNAYTTETKIVPTIVPVINIVIYGIKALRTESEFLMQKKTSKTSFILSRLF